jgi:hypothetical protein
MVVKKKSTAYYPYSAFAIRNYENGNVKQLVLPHMSAFLIAYRLRLTISGEPTNRQKKYSLAK